MNENKQDHVDFKNLKFNKMVNKNQQQNENININNNYSNDEMKELCKYLNKFIELVPNLKQMDRQDKIKKILCSIQLNQANDQPQHHHHHHQPVNYQNHLDSLENLEITPSKSISDLQILQSVLDYILELKDCLDDGDNRNDVTRQHENEIILFKQN